jgi:hypothetical protein
MHRTRRKKKKKNQADGQIARLRIDQRDGPEEKKETDKQKK